MYLGNSPTQQAFTPAVDVFSGNGSTTAFTLSRPVASVAQVQAFIENVPQSPVDAFTVSGNTITFTSAPPSGSSNIYVRYTSPITQVIQPSDGSVGTNQLAAGAVTAAKLASGQVFALNGVSFPATQVPSSDANTLDDYEEGTWTPVLTPSAGTITSQTCSGSYVKVGRLVTVTFNAQSLTGTMTAISQLTGLPFVINTTTPIGASREWFAAGNMWEIVGNSGANTCSIIRYDNSSACNAQFAWNGTLSYITNA